MKKVAFLIVGFSLSACGKGLPVPGTSPGLHGKSYSEINQMVRVGMTKEQVRGILGKPYTSRTVNGETTWSYVGGGMNADAFNPFTVRSGYEYTSVGVFFGRSGRVKNVAVVEDR